MTRYAWDGSTRILRQRPDGTTFDITIDGAGLDEHVATLTGTARQFLHQDPRGSVYLTTSSPGGAPQEWVSYSAYGEATVRQPDGAAIPTTNIAAQYGFNGLPHDFALGLVDMRARMYRPAIGRFLSPDPLGLVDGTNRFAFVGASPLVHRDPLGLCTVDPDAQCQSPGEQADRDAQLQFHTEWGMYIRHQDELRAERERERVRDIQAAGRYFRRAYNVTRFVLAGQATVLGVGLSAKASLFSFLVAGSSSNGGYEGMGGVAGTGIGFVAPFVPRVGIAVVDDAMVTAATVADDVARGTTTVADDVAGGAITVADDAASAATAVPPAAPGPSAPATYPEGSFSIIDWRSYPAGAPQPTGTFRVLQGAEYEQARRAANNANARLHKADPGTYGGREIHEIKPVKFGGSPTALQNKIPLAPPVHRQFTTWWAALLRSINGR